MSAKRAGPRIWILLLLLLGGALIGSALWSLLFPVLPSALTQSFEIGSTNGPWNLDLHFVAVSLGVILRFNLGGMIGMILFAVGFYRVWSR